MNTELVWDGTLAYGAKDYVGIVRCEPVSYRNTGYSLDVAGISPSPILLIVL